MDYSYSRIKRTERTEKVPRSCFVGVAFFHPYETSILKQHIISCHIFQLDTLKGAKKSSDCGPSEAEQAKRCQKRFLTPKR